MVNPVFGIFLLLACLALAAAQIWEVAGHIAGTRSLAAHEPVARAVFAGVFLIAAFGALVALLEHRNGRVIIEKDSITACCWTGCRTAISLEDIASLGYLATDSEQTDFAFHWLYITTREGRTVRLGGGPWREPGSVSHLRNTLVDRLQLEEARTDKVRWALLFPAKLTRWSSSR